MILQNYIQYFVAILSPVLSILIYMIRSHAKNGKYKKTLLFLEKVKEFMEIAETHKNWNGEEKRDFVKSMLAPFLKENGITESDLEKIIENNILFSKSINYKGE